MNTLKLLLPLVLLAPAVNGMASEGKAKIVTQAFRDAECISQVTIRKLDGQNRFLSPQGFEVDAGKHSMSGSIAFNSGNCPGHSGNPRSNKRQYAPLEADFEAGKTYYVGFDHSATDPEEWAYVIWKVE